ncbi:phosphotransferase [Thioalkalivibrio thiocyanoxidans]|uniref:phosphotransferase n=1 Tax=Thioalkalivibrio thiocyanoxidans TaxID=152475 RepID=UPI00037EB781|nr:phosphotransferase [Thioalkalivibrio thiocyanoxidans]
MSDPLLAGVLAATRASAARRGPVLQQLWSGYGEIVRYDLEGTALPSVIVKHVVFPAHCNHPRGWNSDHGDRRKRHSYEVEMAFYRDWAALCPDGCRVPRCLEARPVKGGHSIILEDLDAAGFSGRREHLDFDEAVVCLRWLAWFHATFLGMAPAGLWPVGSYWHLATRRQEWAAIEDPAIRRTATAIDERLNAARFRTVIHGDAKVANFCFGPTGAVAALDFQYVGGGCGMKDVAYFLGSCLDESEQEQWEAALLDTYFASLRGAVAARLPDVDLGALEAEWRDLFRFAQADFYRFLVGWSPGHWKLHDYSRRVALEVVAALDSV